MLCVLSCAGSSDTGASDLSKASEEYLALLGNFPVENQGRGVDPYDPHIETEQVTVYAQILSSECYRYGTQPSEESAARIRKAAQWLIDNSDLDGDGKDGWGLTFAWDAFGDGSVNSADHPYTIITAICVLGLVDALNTNGVFSEVEKEQIAGLVNKVIERWCLEGWTQSGATEGFFWYSLTDFDSYFLPNVSSFMCGAIQKYVGLHGGRLSPSQRELYKDRARDGMAAINSSVESFNGMPFWNYSVPDALEPDPNDLVHHMYILYGIELYKSHGGTVSFAWSKEDALNSARLFTDDKAVYHYPHDSHFAIATYVDLTRPANLWGVGMLLAFASAAGDDSLANKALETVKRSYGTFPDLTLYPLYWDSDVRFYPRYAAHVLFGIAVKDFRQ